MVVSGANIGFEVLHVMVKESLKLQGHVLDWSSKEVGTWIYRFLRSPEQKLSLKFPSYDPTTRKELANYIYTFDLLLKILAMHPCREFSGTCLFDVFSYRREGWSLSRIPALPFREEQREILKFGEDTFVTKTVFLPLFKSDQLMLTGKSTQDAMSNAFSLFALLRQQNLVPYPVLFDTTSPLTLFVVRNQLLDEIQLLKKEIATSEYNNNQLDVRLTDAEAEDITRTYFFKFPYSSNIDPILYHEFTPRTRLFEVTYGSRFVYKEIKDDEVLLLRAKNVSIDEKEVLEQVRRIRIIDTDHVKEIFEELQSLAKNWSYHNFVPYITPFPARWFCFINKGETLDYWINFYKSSFPEVNGTLQEQVISLINKIYELNWAASFFCNNKGRNLYVGRSNLYQESINSMITYLRNEYNVEPVQDPENIVRSKALVMDCSLLSLVNLIVVGEKDNIDVIIPDFVYFFNSPFLKYKVIEFQFNALLGGLRPKLDPLYDSYTKVWNKLKPSVTHECTDKQKRYFSKFQKTVEQSFVADFSSEYDLNESELITELNDRERKTSSENDFKIDVTASNQKVFHLKASTPILINEHGIILSSRASILKRGIRFLPLTEISKSINSDFLAEKLSRMPSDALQWKQLLAIRKNKSRDLFGELRALGLSIQESTFEHNYITNSKENKTEFHLPRSKSDWQIVCNFLNIKESHLAWRNHRCHGDFNRLKKTYCEIISYLVSTSNYGVNTDEKVLVEVANIFERGVGKFDPELDRITEARYIIQNITRELELVEAMDIQIVCK